MAVFSASRRSLDLAQRDRVARRARSRAGACRRDGDGHQQPVARDADEQDSGAADGRPAPAVGVRSSAAGQRRRAASGGMHRRGAAATSATPITAAVEHQRQRRLRQPARVSAHRRAGRAGRAAHLGRSRRTSSGLSAGRDDDRRRDQQRGAGDQHGQAAR